MRITIAFIIVLLILSTPSSDAAQAEYSPSFDGTEAFAHLEAQCEFGPRPPGSENLSMAREYIMEELAQQGWSVSLQNFTYLGVKCSNIIADWPSHSDSFFIIGAHYDTRPHADQDPNPENKQKPVLGANDGASGTGVLLELARALPESSRSSVELVFFDAEDSGYINGWDWIVGSTHFVSNMDEQTRTNVTGMILLDMVGDANLVIPRETQSTKSLQDDLWKVARDLGYGDIFLDSPGGSILDDHRPFLDAGIPAVDLIHYPFPDTWHTLNDTVENCSPTSLQAVGDVVESYLVTNTNTYTTNASSPILPVTIILLVSSLAAVIIWQLRRK